MNEARGRTTRRWLMAIASVVVLAAVVVFVLHHRTILGFFADQEKVRAWVEGFGAAAPVAAIALTAALVIFAPIPNQIVGTANGYIFGVGLGTLYSMIGLVLGTIAAMAIARRLGRPWVERFVDPERLERWDHVGGRWGPIVFFVAFLVPGLPDDLLCFVIGLSRLQLGPMIVIVTLGRLPGMMGASWIGANAGDLPGWVWPFAIGAGIVLAAVLFVFGDRIEAASLALGKKLGRGRRGAGRGPRA